MTEKDMNIRWDDFDEALADYNKQTSQRQLYEWLQACPLKIVELKEYIHSGQIMINLKSDEV